MENLSSNCYRILLRPMLYKAVKHTVNISTTSIDLKKTLNRMNCMLQQLPTSNFVHNSRKTSTFNTFNTWKTRKTCETISQRNFRKKELFFFLKVYFLLFLIVFACLRSCTTIDQML